ncbi:MAG: type I restriction endonuclease, partial [Sideroxydans sp.]
MSPSTYTEDLLVEQPAIQLFAELGWETLSASDEMLGASGTLGRETKSEVVLAARLRSVLTKLNTSLPPEAISAAVDELSRDRSAMTPTGANREFWQLMRDGLRVSVPDAEKGGVKTERVNVVDWDNPSSNDFLLVSQMTIVG